ncbi:MAG TPA: hypothetical protein VNY25_10040 [Steroidobacteraceae bacterium]|nr:hypothetical protein [Steroidobacteraceae bacterium]
MPSSISSSDIAITRPGFIRLTASDRPGVAQPVPVRDIPAKPWARMLIAAATLLMIAVAGWEWRMRALGLEAGDLDDGPSFWAEQRRRIDAGGVAIAILGDSRILFDTDLDRFAALTGVRPVQLAIAGSNGLPFLENLAAAPGFRGLAIVGIADRSYFRAGAGLGGPALERYRFESPAVRASFLLHRSLSRVLAFLDDKYRLNTLVRQMDEGWRVGVLLPVPERLWKLGTTTDNRQTHLWWRVENDERVRTHQRATWPRAVPPVPAAGIASTVERTRAAVEKIRARGGEVVFVRPPSAPELRGFEEQTVPRALGWATLLARAAVRGVHFNDYPAMQGLELPEYSHLSRACATVFTDAYVRALAALTPRLALIAHAPPPLAPADCNPTQGSPANHGEAH